MADGVVAALRRNWAPPTFEAREPTRAGIAYSPRSSRGIAPRADVYLPEARGGRPPVLLVHGGGFVLGSRRMKAARFLATRLVEAGYAVASVDYRLVLRGGGLREAVQDVAEALRWWGGADGEAGEPTVVLGKSAGATLALLAAERHPERVRRVTTLYPLVDFETLPAPRGPALRRWVVRGEDPRGPLGSPLVRDLPLPVDILHGTSDGVVPVDQAERFAARRRERGLPTELRLYAGAPHGFINLADAPETEACLRDLLDLLPR